MYPLLCILFYSCSAGSKESSSGVDASDIVTLNPSDQWLKFPVDEDTEIGWYAQAVEWVTIRSRRVRKMCKNNESIRLKRSAYFVGTE